MNLTAQIEQFLLAAGGFVPTAQICDAFGLPERRLRQDADRPGLLDEFAVSSTRENQHGYIHHRHLPTKDWLPIKNRLRRHSISQLRRIRKWQRARRNILTRRNGPPSQELHTGQLVLL